MNGHLLVLAAICLASCWLTPWPSLGVGPFSAHMIAHMGIVAVAAPLLALALAGSPLDPVARAPSFFAPIPISLFEFVIVWVWHAPALHHAARHSGWAWVAEQGLFLFAGVALWLAVFGGAAAERRSRAASGVIALLMTSMHMTLLGALFALAPRVLFSHPDSAGDPLADQHMGGAIMLLVGGLSYLAGGLWLTAGLLRGAFQPRRVAR